MFERVRLECVNLCLFGFVCVCLSLRMCFVCVLKSGRDGILAEVFQCVTKREKRRHKERAGGGEEDYAR